jgi:predicted nucleic acid-binding protein
LGALSIYLDTSIVVPLFLPDPFVGRTRSFFAAGPADLMVSDLVSAEFAFVVGIRVRKKEISSANGKAAFVNFDNWTRRRTIGAETSPDDIRRAERMLRRLNLNLRAPDAIHVAIAQRLGAELATFDVKMADCAHALGVPVVAI